MALEIYTGIKFLSLIFEIVNLGLLSGLLYFYIKSYRQIKFGFTIGLILFASIFLIKSIVVIGFNLLGLLTIDIPYIVSDIIQIIGLSILLIITWKY